jgi:hypothetical protein
MNAKQRPRTGLRATKAAIQLHGLSVVSRRTVAGKALIAWRQALVDALGGETNVSPQKAALIDAVCRTKAILDHLDAFILGQSSLVNRRNRTLLPIVRERMTIADSLSRSLSLLGLEKLEPPPPSLDEYITRVEPPVIDEPTDEPTDYANKEPKE